MLAKHPHEVLIAFTSPAPVAIRGVVKLLEPFKVPLTRLPLVTDPAKVRVPAYVPDTPEVRADLAQYYDRVAEAVAWLAERGLGVDRIDE